MYEYSLRLAPDSMHPQLIRERELEYNGSGRMYAPSDIADYMMSVYGVDYMAEEHLYLIGLNTKGDVTAIFHLAQGTVDCCPASPREIMIRALLAGATRVALLHNHPSGDTTPSNLDFVLTKRVATVGNLLNVKLVDHIIVGSGKHYSMMENNNEILDGWEVPDDWK